MALVSLLGIISYPWSMPGFTTMSSSDQSHSPRKIYVLVLIGMPQNVTQSLDYSPLIYKMQTERGVNQLNPPSYSPYA